MNNPENAVGIHVTFPETDRGTDILMSDRLDIPEESGVSESNIGHAIIGSVCATCPYNGNGCNPSYRDGVFVPVVLIENHQVRESGYSAFENIPNKCLIVGNAYTYKYNPDDPSQFELVPATAPSQDSTNALS
jgi:hypothetical protein